MESKTVTSFEGMNVPPLLLYTYVCEASVAARFVLSITIGLGTYIQLIIEYTVIKEAIYIVITRSSIFNSI